MGKRIAFVGLSGPLMYDYRQPAATAPSDLSSSPNPIFDSPYGLLLLYDEIWFLCRSLCPNNMRGLPFVHFLDEEQRLPDVNAIDVAPLAEAFRADPAAQQRFDAVQSLFAHYDAVRRSLRIDWDAAPDNHTHGLQIGALRTSANAVSLENILFDLQVVERLEDSRVELFANSFARRYLDSASRPKATDLTQLLVVDRIPNWQSPAGPYHPIIDEVRDDRYLSEFREWIAGTTENADASDVKEVKTQVEAALEESKKRLLVRHLDESRMFNAAGKTIIATAAELVVPFVGATSGLVQDAKEAHSATKLRWQGFLVNLELAEFDSEISEE